MQPLDRASAGTHLAIAVPAEDDFTPLPQGEDQGEGKLDVSMTGSAVSYPNLPALRSRALTSGSRRLSLPEGEMEGPVARREDHPDK